MSEVTFDFSGRKFVVVGASSGMGREIARELAEAGAQVLAIARNEERLRRLQAEYPSRIEIAILDVTYASEEAWNRVLDDFIQRFGKINGGVYTAGTTAVTPLRTFDEAQARNIMETGFWGAVKFLRAATKKKYAEAASSYVLFSSVAGCCGDKGLGIYSAVKAAVRIAVHSFAQEVQRERHRINTICPGYVQTEMTQQYSSDMGVPERVQNRHILGIGTPSDVGGMVLFLLSDRSQWITGSDTIVDGGYLCGAYN